MMKLNGVSAISFILLFSFCEKLIAATPLPAITQPIPKNEIMNYDHYSKNLKTLIDKAASLSELKLTYLYGSSSPANGGMDCSGTMYHLLTSAGAKPPRQADQMYRWVVESGKIYKVTTADLNSAEFAALKPGDLLFWSGTYNVDREVTHVMIYLGKTKDNKPLMFGASDGRTYQNQKMRGVSVFDVKLPKPNDKSTFVAYGCIPTLTCE